MPRLIPAAALLAGSAFASPALASAMPNLIPTHDISGTYLVTGQQGPKLMKVAYSKSANTLRIDPPGGQAYILYDFSTKDGKMVLPQMQRYMDRPEMANRADAIEGKADGDDVTITKAGTETIAGHECTDYTAANKTKNTSATLCVTDDGVLLKLASANGSAVAQTISYGTVPPASVQVPAGYTPFVMPQLPPGMGAVAPGATGGNVPGMAIPGSGPP